MAEKTYTVDIDGLKITGSAEKIDELASVYKFASIGHENELRSLIDTADSESRNCLLAEIEKVRSKYNGAQKQLKDAISDSDYSQLMTQVMSRLIEKPEVPEKQFCEDREILFQYTFRCENDRTGFSSNDFTIRAHDYEEAELAFWESNPDCGVEEGDFVVLVDTNDPDCMEEALVVDDICFTAINPDGTLTRYSYEKMENLEYWWHFGDSEAIPANDAPIFDVFINGEAKELAPTIKETNDTENCLRFEDLIAYLGIDNEKEKD